MTYICAVYPLNSLQVRVGQYLNSIVFFLFNINQAIAMSSNLITHKSSTAKSQSITDL